MTQHDDESVEEHGLARDGIGARIRAWPRPVATSGHVGESPREEKGEAPRGRALIMPGIGYTVDRPLLYWAARALSWDGWSVDRLWLDLPDVVDFPRTIDRMDGLVDSWVSGITSSRHDDGPVMVVTKSLSTLTYPHLVDLGLSAVLLTPVLNPPPCDPAESVITVPDSAPSSSVVAPLLCAGDADPYFNKDKAASLTEHGRVRVYPKANHSIEVSGDWSTSIRYLHDVTESIVRYGRVVRGAGRGEPEGGDFVADDMEMICDECG